jgi:hypothetical protein
MFDQNEMMFSYGDSCAARNCPAAFFAFCRVKRIDGSILERYAYPCYDAAFPSPFHRRIGTRWPRLGLISLAQSAVMEIGA